MTISANIFNTEKTDYVGTPLFLGEDNGLIDTVNKNYPNIWNLYKKLKSIDWSESEFDFSPCNTEFKTCPKSVSEMMIKTLAWQWEADSVAARSIVPLVAPFVSSSELWVAWSSVGANECLHSLVYSEIVRNSFDHPDEVLKEILAVKESLTRLETISEVMANTYDLSHRLALKQIDKNDPKVYDQIFLTVVTLYALERIQFMASFAVTFAIADTGAFLPIGSAVQKICQDEFEVHVQLDKAILDYELQTERGLMAFQRLRPQFEAIVNDVVNSELKWVDYLFSEGRELVGLNADLLKSWVLYCAAEVYKFFGIKAPYELPAKNPIGFINDWIRIDAIQASPQENRANSYMVGMVINDHDNEVFDFVL